MLPYFLGPHFDVIRGRVVAIGGQSMPIVSGGGLVLNGTGGMRVRTAIQESNEFWIRDRNGTDHHFPMGSRPVPPMLLNHAVTVVLSNDQVCAIANHSTGRQIIYPSVAGHRDVGRETGNYDHGAVQIVAWVLTFFWLIFGVAFGPEGLLGAVILCVLMWGVVALVLRRQGRTQVQINTHNLAIDEQIRRLIALPNPEQK